MGRRRKLIRNKSAGTDLVALILYTIFSLLWTIVLFLAQTLFLTLQRLVSKPTVGKADSLENTVGASGTIKTAFESTNNLSDLLEASHPLFAETYRNNRKEFIKENAPQDVGEGFTLIVDQGDIYLEEVIVPAFIGYIKQANVSRYQIEDAFKLVSQIYELEYDDGAYYIRELDPHSKWFKGSVKEIIKLRLARQLAQSLCDAMIYISEPSEFHQNLVNYRKALDPEFLFRSVVILRAEYGIIPDARLFSVIFGGRIESIIDSSRAKSMGFLSLTKNMRDFFSQQKLPFSTESLHALLDQVVQQLELDDSDWFFKEISKQGWRIETGYNESSDHGYVSGLFNFSNWGDGDFELPEEHPIGNSATELPIACFEFGEDPEYSTSLNGLIGQLATQVEIKKKTENYVREYLGLPFVGEGQWVSEIRLLRLIEKKTNLKVVHQWSPDWLGRQRLDVAIPELKLAFEYQGIQHFEPVEYFGGEKAFEKVKRQDKKKKKLCLQNGVKLIYVNYFDPWEKIENMIPNLASQVQS